MTYLNKTEYQKLVKEYEKAISFIRENRIYSKFCNKTKKNRQYYLNRIKQLKKKRATN